MGDRMVNGRRPLEWELPALERGYARLLERDMEALAGLLTGEPVSRHEGRTVSDIAVDFGTARRRS